VSEYVSDVAGLVKIAKSRNPGLPLFLLGHSAGVSSPRFTRLRTSRNWPASFARVLHSRCRRPALPSPPSRR
jgi:hypothetical protein